MIYILIKFTKTYWSNGCPTNNSGKYAYYFIKQHDLQTIGILGMVRRKGICCNCSAVNTNAPSKDSKALVLRRQYLPYIAFRKECAFMELAPPAREMS